MKVKTIFRNLVFIGGILILLSSCNKDSSDDGTPVTSDLNGTWETTAWYDPNDMLRVSITLTTTNNTGVFSYINDKAILTGFFVGDVVYKDITKTGTDTYNATMYYRHGPANALLAYTSGVLTLQSSGTVLHAKPSHDPLTGITPPEHYFQKK